MALFLAAFFVLTQAVAGQAQDNRPVSFADLADRVSPAVVNITTSTMVSTNMDGQPGMPGSPFEDFFKDFQNQGPQRSSALGSGFVISPDGYIVTNNHVIEGADEIQIEFFPGGEDPLEAVLIGTDPNTDIALLKVEATDLPYVSFGDSDASRVGDWVMAVGNPLGQGFSVSAGIVSARNRELSGTYDDYIQTDAAINRGNSGGPLFNMDGDVVGVNTAILSPNGGSIGIGFSMASNVVTKVVDQLQEFGETRRGWLGVRIQDVSPDMVDAIDGLQSVAGALVTSVPEGPAMEAGVEAGDVILTFDGREVADTRELVRIVADSPVGAEVVMNVLRDGENVELTVVLGRREEAQGAIPASAENPKGAPSTGEVLGLTLSAVNEDAIAQFDLDPQTEGLVIVGVDPMSDAAENGLQVGDVITEAGQMAVSTVAEFEDRVSAAKDEGRKSLLILVNRDNMARFLALSLVE
ncbi:Do family serine endopeptidase [Marivivens donghaensis]|uniref:Probable periplasmic serine endoprotease DegP-like n=1 Tax=Marivivens donghaensis TaxID=1699413 RepID=A0ABX0VWJ0_9RHOB|nr:Do family serine endopeptidase [Marivivens donghaensis]NIY72449.1 Do family serine endopeptidase [Marivivens donghaensis]